MRWDHPNRFHAACRETASASPIIAQLTSRSRRMSAISCTAAAILSKAVRLRPSTMLQSGHCRVKVNTTCVVGLFFFLDDWPTEVYAFVANKDAGASNERPDLSLCFSTEGAAVFAPTTAVFKRCLRHVCYRPHMQRNRKHLSIT